MEITFEHEKESVDIADLSCGDVVYSYLRDNCYMLLHSADRCNTGYDFVNLKNGELCSLLGNERIIQCDCVLTVKNVKEN